MYDYNSVAENLLDPSLLLYVALLPTGYILGRFLNKKVALAITVTLGVVYMIATVGFWSVLGLVFGGLSGYLGDLASLLLQPLAKGAAFTIILVGSCYLGARFRESTKS